MTPTSTLESTLGLTYKENTFVISPPSFAWAFNDEASGAKYLVGLIRVVESHRAHKRFVTLTLPARRLLLEKLRESSLFKEEGIFFLSKLGEIGELSGEQCAVAFENFHALAPAQTEKILEDLFEGKPSAQEINEEELVQWGIGHLEEKISSLNAKFLSKISSLKNERLEEGLLSQLEKIYPHSAKDLAAEGSINVKLTKLVKNIESQGSLFDREFMYRLIDLLDNPREALEIHESDNLLKIHTKMKKAYIETVEKIGNMSVEDLRQLEKADQLIAGEYSSISTNFHQLKSSGAKQLEFSGRRIVEASKKFSSFKKVLIVIFIVLLLALAAFLVYYFLKHEV